MRERVREGLCVGVIMGRVSWPVRLFCIKAVKENHVILNSQNRST